MKYTITASSINNKNGQLHLKNGAVIFGTTKITNDTLPSPVDLYLSALAACILKNVERFSTMMHFNYSEAKINLSTTHLLKPSRLEHIKYEVVLVSDEDDINTSLLNRNLQKFGTIYYMVSKSCTVSGSVLLEKKKSN